MWTVRLFRGVFVVSCSVVRMCMCMRVCVCQCVTREVTSLVSPPWYRVTLFFLSARTTTLLIAKKECRVRCYNTLHVATCTPLGRQLHVLNIESPISGQIPYPDERRSRHGRIREVGLPACIHISKYSRSLISEDVGQSYMVIAH